jgi:hypothetical protein
MIVFIYHQPTPIFALVMLHDHRQKRKQNHSGLIAQNTIKQLHYDMIQPLVHVINHQFIYFG